MTTRPLPLAFGVYGGLAPRPSPPFVADSPPPRAFAGACQPPARPRSDRLVAALEKHARAVLAREGVLPHYRLRAIVAAETGELLTLVNRAVRCACDTGRIVRLHQGRYRPDDLVLLPAAFEARVGAPPERVARLSSGLERALHRAVRARSWSRVVAALVRQALSIGVDAAPVQRLAQWVLVRWYNHPSRASWACRSPACLVDLRERWVDPDDALAHLAARLAEESGDPPVELLPPLADWPHDDAGAEFAAALDPVCFLHRTSGAWVWFRAVTVPTVTAGAVTLRTVRWSLVRAGLRPAHVGPPPGIPLS